MTKFGRVDIISLFDIDFSGPCISKKDILILDRVQGDNPPTDLIDIYSESFDWLFYRSGEEMPILPGFRRFYFSLDRTNLQNCLGGTILVSEKLGAGVYSVWQSFSDQEDPLKLKEDSWKVYPDSLEFLHSLGLAIEEVKRHYPFVGITVPDDNVSNYVRKNVAFLGNLFTSGYEKEDMKYLSEYLEENISRRVYEGFYVRWTDALAIYSDKIGDKTYFGALGRAVQIFEMCILLDTVLRILINEHRYLEHGLSFLTPRPWSVKRQRFVFTDIKMALCDYPPAQSVEARRILHEAYEKFGIPKTLEVVEKSMSHLENRADWAKTQGVVLISILLYVLGEVFGFWKFMRGLLGFE